MLRALALLCLAACAPACDAVAYRQRTLTARYARAGVIARTATLPSGTLRYYDGGSGPPLVLLHGFGLGALENWHQQVPAFARTHRVIAPDLYWFGESVPSSAVTDARAQAAGVIELLDELHVAQADFVGMSYGGLVALHIDLAHPERVGRMVLADSAGLPPTADERAVIARSFGGAHRLEDILVPATVEQLRLLLDQAFYRAPFIPRFALEQTLREFHRHGNEKAQLCRSLDADLLTTAELATVRAHTLLVWGEHDHLVPPTIGQRMKAGLPDAELLLFDGSGHSAVLEEPKRFERAVLDFLAAGPRGGRAAPR